MENSWVVIVLETQKAFVINGRLCSIFILVWALRSHNFQFQNIMK